MLQEVDPEEIRQAIGQRVEVMAFGLPYVGILEDYDEKSGRLQIRDQEDVAFVERERIESFRIIKENPAK